MAKKKQQQQGAMSPEKYIRERARTLEIGKCYVNRNWQEEGLASVIVTRNHKQGTFTVANYLVDTYCTGVKNAFYMFNGDEEEYDDLLDRMRGGLDLMEISYNEAHNIVYAAVEFAEEAGIKPCKEWAVAKYILEEDDDNVPLIEYEMGKDGKHFLVAHDNLELTTYLPLLKKNLKPDEFDYTMGIMEVDDWDEDKDDEEWDDEEEEDEDENYYEHRGVIDKEDSSAYNYNLNWEDAIPIEMEVAEQPELRNPDIEDIFDAYEYIEEEIEELFDMPHESLRQDLEDIIRYKMTNEDDIEYMEMGTPLAIMCLAEVGNEDSLKLLLDSLRLDEGWFRDVLVGDEDFAYRNTLVKLAKNHLDLLADYMREPGRTAESRDMVMHAVADMAQHYPEMRPQVVEWFRDLLNFYVEALPKMIGCDSDAAAYAIVSVHDFGGKELYKEVEKLYDTRLVNDEICGLRHKMLLHLQIAIDAPKLYPYGKLRPLNIFQRMEEYYEYRDGVNMDEL